MTSVRCFTPRSGARIRLVCLPHAGGAAAAFRGWGALLPDDIEVLAIQYPGRHDRFDDPFVPELVDLAATVADDLPDDLPLALFGHSMGAMVAFELARHVVPRHVIVSAPPIAAPVRTAASDDDILATVRSLGGRGVELLDNPVIRSVALPAIRHDFAMLARYRAGAPTDRLLHCPVTAFAGRDDPVCPPESARRWSERCAGPFELHTLPGGHHYLEDHADAVTAMIARRLDSSRIVDSSASHAVD